MLHNYESKNACQPSLGNHMLDDAEKHACVRVHHVGKAGFATLLLDLFPPGRPPRRARVEHHIQI